MSDNQPFEGMEFVFTGQLQALSRAQAQDAVRARGGTVVGRVGPSTTHVVAGDTSGRRREHGRILGAQELSETQFVQMLEGDQASGSTLV